MAIPNGISRCFYVILRFDVPQLLQETQFGNSGQDFAAGFRFSPNAIFPLCVIRTRKAPVIG